MPTHSSASEWEKLEAEEEEEYNKEINTLAEKDARAGNHGSEGGQEGDER